MANVLGVTTGTDGDDTLTGSGFIVGDAGDDTITGGSSRDVIRGGSGNDTINAGGGNDTVRGDGGNDTINGGTGNDLITGDAGNDIIDGGAGSDTLYGGTGDDTLTGGTGADTFMFIGGTGRGSDTITDFDTANDCIDLSMVSEAIAFSELTLTPTTDGTGTVITHSALGGSITLTGVVSTDLTADMFAMPDGTTTSVEVDSGRTVSRWADPFEGTEGNDILQDASPGTRIVGKGGNDTILGGEGDDTLEGGAGADWLFGEEGADTLKGGTGDDLLWGGSGDDTFVFEASNGEDTIHDYSDGDDKIDLSAFTTITGFANLTITEDDDAVVIDLTSQGGGKIRIEDVELTDIEATDFVFYDGG